MTESEIDISNFPSAFAIQTVGTIKVIGCVIVAMKNISSNQKRGVKLQSGIYYINYTTQGGESASPRDLRLRSGSDGRPLCLLSLFSSESGFLKVSRC